jgi:hypothetical protein
MNKAREIILLEEIRYCKDTIRDLNNKDAVIGLLPEERARLEVYQRTLEKYQAALAWEI